VAGTPNADSYIRKTVIDYRSPHGIMGVQLSAHQTRCLGEMAQERRRLLGCVTPFYLRRRNLVAQGISLYKSMAAGVFHSYQTAAAREQLQTVAYDAEAIRTCCSQLLADELYFDALFERTGIRPLQFTYEDLVVDPSAVLTWMARTVDPAAPGPILARSQSVKKLGNWTSFGWEQRFRKDRADFLAEVERWRPRVLSDAPTAPCHDEASQEPPLRLAVGG
jgi:LPS sulfotransferase NodH